MAANLDENTCTFLSASVSALFQDTYTGGSIGGTEAGIKLPLTVGLTELDCPTERWTATHYQHAVQLMAPTIQQISHQFLISDNLDDELYRFLQWTRNEKVFKHIYSLLRHPKHPTSIPLGILLCTATLERALGNAYLLLNSQVPSLMKDLLVSPELQQIFGTENMALLQVTVGPPTSLNIRNILWHGFAAPEEIPEHLGLFLFATVLNLGYTLNTKGMSPESLPYRTVAKFDCVDDLCGIFPDIQEVEHFKILEQLFLESKFIPNIMRPYWQDSLHKLKQNRYGECLVLLLPQMEHSLRCLFTLANNCPERMLTAEVCFNKFEQGSLHFSAKNIFFPSAYSLVSFYTTFDEILAPCLINGEENKLRETLDDQYLKSFLRCIETSIQNYKPLFHPSSIVTRLIQNLVKECLHWPIHSNTEPLQNDVIEAVCNATIVNLSSEWQDLLKRLLLTDKLDEIFAELKIALSAIQCKTLYRPKLEWEALLQMKRILRNSFEAGRQIQLFLTERSEMMERHQLRSRQRATYHRMLMSIPTLKTGLLVIGATMCRSLIGVNQLGEVDSNEKEKKSRFLKSIEKTSENLKTLTDHTKNRWDESKEIILKRLFPKIIKQCQTVS